MRIQNRNSKAEKLGTVSADRREEEEMEVVMAIGGDGDGGL